MPSYQPIPPDTPYVDTPTSAVGFDSWARFEKGRWASIHSDKVPHESMILRLTTILRALEHAVVIVLLVVLSVYIWSSGTTSDAAELATGRSGFVPDFAYNTSVSFDEDVRFTLKYQTEHALNNSWSEFVQPRKSSNWDTGSVIDVRPADELPGDGGWIRIPDASKYGLIGGLPVPDTKTEDFVVSVFHSLHCLAALQMAIAKMQRGEKVEEIHVDHCVNYIRQSVMCMSDMTLETPIRGDDGKLEHNVNGIGNVHQCRNFDDIVDWVNENSDRRGPMPGVSTWAGKDRMKKDDLV